MNPYEVPTIYRVIRKQEVLIPFSGQAPRCEVFASLDKDEALNKCDYYNKIIPEDYFPMNPNLGKTYHEVVEDDPLGGLILTLRSVEGFRLKHD